MSLNKTRFMAIILAFILTFGCLSARAEDSKATFDRYQSLYKSYQEAVTRQIDSATLEQMAAELQAASRDYYRSIGVEVTFDAENPGEPVVTQSEQFADSADSQGIGVVKSDLQRKYEEILSALGSPNRESRYAEIQKQLEDFLSICNDAALQKEAVFQLSEVVYERTRSMAKAQEVLLKFAKATGNSEFRRQAMARIVVLKKKSIVAQKREEFKQIQQSTINKWGKYSKTSWLAIPVKVWSLGSYAVNNLKRRAKGRELDKALKDYDRAVLDTYPAGSADALTRSSLIPLNTVRVMVNGRTSFHYRIERAKQATSSIFFQTLLYQDDETGNRIADILIEKAQSGVDVRLILDDFFSFNKKSGVIQRLRNGGVQVMINNPILKNLLKANFRSHQKLFIIDESIAIVGGMNTGDEYAKGEITEYGWRDTDVELQGPIVREIVELFERNWEDLTLKKWNETGALSKYKKAKEIRNEFAPLKNVDRLIRGPLPVYFEQPPIYDDVSARFVKTAPITEQDDNVLDLFEIYLNRARSEVILETGYFIPTERLVNAIAAARSRGVTVKIITNSLESNNHPYGGLAGRATYEPVLRTGARIFEWQGAQTLHSKVSLFDNFAVTIGAYNINSRSHSCDSEDVIAIEDRRVAQAFRYVLNKDLSRCREITLEEAISWDKNLITKAKMQFFSLFKFMF
ncbi:MAG: phosphatidylserine/phosphatidylglycerophosphate/cardiolipin synthase family protein [Candidatus Riflebacteria bacterium]|nr:phosphatidylserine/phosphatidylglycerophosphate/cardiolipin synthase family protein [Candidatus Riflebacteria bacterium]